VLFNAVGGYGQDQITAGADVDFIYTELWENDGIRSYNDIVQQVVKARAKSDKALVFPAYMNRGLSQVSPPGTSFNEASVRLANAVIFAAGAAHLELGDDEGMLSTEYFPSQTLVMGVGLKRAMHDYYDFLVAYENLLRDKVADSTNRVVVDDISTSTDGARGTLWTLVKSRPGTTIVHLINLTNTPSSDWRDSIGTYPVPETLTDVPLKIYYSATLPEGARLWYASPDRDHGNAQELDYTTGSDEQGTFVTLTVPHLQYWDMLWLDTEPGP
jgi:dextranase